MAHNFGLQPRHPRDRDNRLKLSIIIATHARPDSLTRLIGSLTPQLHVNSHELIVAENGTPAPAPLTRGSMLLVHLHEPRPGKCRIQNRAIRASHGEIVVCLDDDLVAAPDYVASVEQFFAAHPEFAAMKGRVLAAEDPEERVGRALAVYLDLPIADHGEDVVEVRGVLGANMAFRRTALDRVGLFDERLGPGAAGHEEETEMSRRLRRAGFRIGYAPGAIVYHEVDPARADRTRFLRIARERGFCRTLHERHTTPRVTLAIMMASAGYLAARTRKAAPERIARAEKRLEIALGMRDGLRARHAARRSDR
ncbi:MAG: glycosyltransferase family 2 protein [Candidatus Binataceae bacterium]